MKTQVKKLKHYENSEAKVDTGEAKEDFKTQKELMFHNKLMLFKENRDHDIPIKQKPKCVIL